jgi:phosphopantothenoylcysteine decarboxylase/phosphopantothenate--cysteine ligase
VLPRLRDIFPAARIVGWKYELDGERDAVLAKAQRQLEEGRTDACVVNGSAWGAGFGIIERRTPGTVREVATKSALCDALTMWVAAQ